MFRNWILQDLPHVFQPRSLQTRVETITNFHTCPIKSRKFWSFFEFKSKDNNFKDVENLSKSRKDNILESSCQGNNQLDNSSNNVVAVMSKKATTNSNKVYSSKLISNNYVFRQVSRIKSCHKIKKSKSNRLQKFDELTSLLDDNYVPTNMKYKLKGYKTLRNEQAKDFPVLSEPNISRKLQTTTLKSNTLLPSETKISKITSPKETQELSYNSMTDQNQSERTTKLEETKEITNKTLLKTENTNDQIKSQIETKNNESRVKQLEDQTNQVTSLQFSKKNPQNISKQLNPAKSLSNLLSLNRTKTEYNLKDSNNIKDNKEKATSYFIPTVLRSIGERVDNNSQRDSSSVRNLTADNPAMVETEFRSSNKIPRYSMYESRMEQQRRASTLPCRLRFVKARQNSTKQRWSGSDRIATGCCPARSSGSHGSRSKRSTSSYSPTVQTREVSSKCYTREKDPIVRSNILSFDRKMLKTRNSVTNATISTTNITNREVYSRIQDKRIFLGSKSSAGLTKNNSQSFFYGSCNKSSKKNCDDDSSSCKKRKKPKQECDDEMISGKVICTKPRKDCSRPKSCRSEKKVCCTKKPTEPPPPPPPPPPRPSCCKRPKKKKICKRYCCPALKQEDCILKRGVCPTKRGKCQNDYAEERDDYEKPKKRDPTCLPIKKSKSQIYDCSNSKDENDCFNSTPEICPTPKKCSSKRESCIQEKEDDCSEESNEQREICTKPKKKDCCNPRRSSRRSDNCNNNRRYHSETKSYIRKTKSSVRIPIFDVSVVLLRPYQNDAVLRYYSNCGNNWKPSSSYEKDPCNKKKKNNYQKPESKCLNKKTNESICEKPEDFCAKLTTNPRGFKQSQSLCEEQKNDICESSKGTNDDRARLERELQEMQECMGKKKSICNKITGTDKVIGSCKKNNYDKLESIDLKSNATIFSDLSLLN